MFPLTVNRPTAEKLYHTTDSNLLLWQRLLIVKKMLQMKALHLTEIYILHHAPIVSFNLHS